MSSPSLVQPVRRQHMRHRPASVRAPRVLRKTSQSDCDSFSSPCFRTDVTHWQPWLGSGSDKICYCGITPVPPLPPPPGQCGMSIVQSGSNVTVQFYETAVGGARTDGPPVTKTLPQHFGLLPTDLPSSDRMDAGIQAYLDAHPHFNAWVSALEGQAAQVAGDVL